MLSNKDDMEVVQYKTDTTWSMKQRQAFPVHDNDFALAAPGDNVGAAGLKRSEAAYDISEVTILEQEEGESLPPSLLTGSVTLSSKNPSVESLAVTTPLDGHQQYNTRQGDTMKHSEEFQESMAPTPPPKPKHYYHTVHDLKSLCDRALPPLPENTGSRASSTISDSGKNKGTLHQTKQRMVHWIGRPLNKIVTSMVGLHTFANQPEEAKVITPSSSVTSAAAGPVACRDNDVEDAVTTYSDSQLIYHESYYPEPATLPRSFTQKNNLNGKCLRCTVVQITNLASNQEYEYALDVHFNARKITTISGRLQKLTPKASGTSPDDGAATFPIHSPFELTFEFTGHPVQQRLTRSLSFWKRKEQQSASTNAQKPTVHARLRLLSGDCVDAFGIDHMQRYTFTQPLDQELPLNLEMLVKYDYVDLPKDKVSQSCATKIAPGKTASIATALQACAAGDYLTILERGKGFPYWRRYWARMEGDTISLYDFTYHDQKKARGYLPLSTLKAVSQPSDEDLENVCYSRSTGLTIRLQEKSAALLSPVRLEPDEAVHGKVHLFADTPRTAEYWRLTLALYEDYQSESTEDNIDLRYVW